MYIFRILGVNQSPYRHLSEFMPDIVAYILRAKYSNIHVMRIPKVQRYGKISLMYRGTEGYEWMEKKGHGLSKNIIYNLQG